MTTTTRIEIAYTYQGGTPFPWTPAGVTDMAESIRLLRAYIARAPEYGNDPDDYVIVSREVDTVTDDWAPVDAAHALTWGTGPLRDTWAPVAPVTSAPRGITVDRDALETWAGRSLTDEEVSQLEATLHNSSVPDAIATMADSL